MSDEGDISNHCHVSAISLPELFPSKLFFDNAFSPALAFMKFLAPFGIITFGSRAHYCL
jgi:hypothetical protein